ncbi:hypothetical protein QTI27_38830 [Variovorax sp. J31P216]|nr:hypothetical protein [Variovorax sp. J31P216]
MSTIIHALRPDLDGADPQKYPVTASVLRCPVIAIASCKDMFCLLLGHEAQLKRLRRKTLPAP